jgi:G3E family GTPase
MSTEITKPAFKPRYIMIGGFLGAGKTTAVLKLARWLVDKNLRVGLITNDQGSQLVDTTMLLANGFMVEEITGGCFCCRFNSLVEAAENLTAANWPEVFIAEPVGSCTDLVATVSYPLHRMHGDSFVITPLSVLVDPIRAQRVFGLASGSQFSEKVLYIYRKQLEEADAIVINKCDLLTPEDLAKLRRCLAQQFPTARIFEISARHETDLESWFNYLMQETQAERGSMDIDYEIYGDGEALLGWLNATVAVSSPETFSGNAVTSRLATEIQQRLTTAKAAVAHLKMTLDPQNEFGDICVVNLVRNDFVPELSQELPEPITAGQLILNLRAEGEPEILRLAVEESLRATHEAMGVRMEIEHIECFKPGKPQPTHRVAD